MFDKKSMYQRKYNLNTKHVSVPLICFYTFRRSSVHWDFFLLFHSSPKIDRNEMKFAVSICYRFIFI